MQLVVKKIWKRAIVNTGPKNQTLNDNYEPTTRTELPGGRKETDLG